MNRLWALILASVATVQAASGSAGCCTTAAQAEVALPQPLARAASNSGESRSYVANAASLELLVIQSAELALRRSANSRVRWVAERSLRDHRGLSAQLSLAGRRLNILPSPTLLPLHRNMLTELMNSVDFDKQYVSQQRIVSKAAYQMHKSYAQNGTSYTLRGVAQMAATVFASELERFGRL